MAELNKNTFIPIVAAVALGVGTLLGYVLNSKDNPQLIREIPKGTSTFGQVEELIRFVESRYVDPVTREELTELSIENILGALDPHSLYKTPQYVESVNNSMKSKFKGVGIELYVIDDTINIVRPIDGGPAHKAGMKIYDKIISVNDTLVAKNPEMPFSKILPMLRGEVGEKVAIKVLRNNKLVDLDLVIEEVPIKAVDLNYMIKEDVGYIKINKFTSSTYKEFMEVFETFHNQKMKNLIIDLRGNPGGLLSEATNILSQLFYQEDQLLVYTEGRDGDKQEYQSTGKPFFDVDKIAILIDESSASASEVIAGAIQDNDRGIVIGNRSFGKGLVQEEYELSNGGAFRLTVAKYFTPSGRCIQRDYSDKVAYRKSNHVEKVDSTVYLTKNLKRKMYSGGGITPDIILGENVELTDNDRENMKNISFETFYCHIKHPELTQKEVVEHVLSKLKVSERIKDHATRKIQLYYDTYLKGGDVAKKYALDNNDEAIKKAYQYFDGEITL